VFKWKLMLSTLPPVLAILAVKLFCERVLHYDGLIDFSDVGIILTAGVFLTGFVLAGTMADYKEAEKLPGELSCSLETIEDIFVLACTLRPGLRLPRLRADLLAVIDSVLDWLLKQQDVRSVYSAMNRLNGTFQELERQGAGPYASKSVPILLAVRRVVSRIDVIARTGFLPPAYALLEVLIVMIISLLLIARFKGLAAECLLVSFVSMINLYMLRLIKDIDNPFDFRGGVRRRGAGEIDLFPLDEYRERLTARLDEAQSNVLDDERSDWKGAGRKPAAATAAGS
jgi:hypothetical protein